MNLRHWVFDLDDTLYDASCGVWREISARITEYVMEALKLARADAERLRDAYFHRHGTTLAGLMAEHGLEPDPFLAYVHDVDLAALQPDPALRAALSALPGARIVHTNGSRLHAERVLAARGLRDCFEGVYGVDDANYAPKPRPEAHRSILEQARVEPRRAAMVEDSLRNLAEPARLGMTTLWLRPGAPDTPGHVDHAGDDLVELLRRFL